MWCILLNAKADCEIILVISKMIFFYWKEWMPFCRIFNINFYVASIDFKMWNMGMELSYSLCGEESYSCTHHPFKTFPSFVTASLMSIHVQAQKFRGGWHFQISSVSLGGQLQKIVFIRFLLPNIFQIFKSSFFEKKNFEKNFFFQNFKIKNW